jgi:sulfatase modifying factor 1
MNSDSHKTIRADLFMRNKFRAAFVMLALIAGVHQAVAQNAQFFRISGPAATKILALQPDGTLVWSNAQPGTNYTIQTVAALPGGTNWVNYVQLPVTQSVNTNLLLAYNPPVGMALIPAGAFTLGDIADTNASGNGAPTNVNVSAIYMEVNLVTYSQWKSVYNWATNHGYHFDLAGAGKAANHPVQSVDWYDVVKWSNARSVQAGLTPAYYTDAGLTQVYTNGDTDAVYVDWTAKGYRLPTEAEWEKAARGGLSGQRFPWGNTLSESQDNYYGNTVVYSYDLGPNGYNAIGMIGGLPYTSPVGSFAANGYGLYDMAGNVHQWCWDWYATPYGQPTTTDPTGPATGNYRVLRGGVWNAGAFYARCAYRLYDFPFEAGNNYGFRCVRRL